jgi:hypothetical protein
MLEYRLSDSEAKAIQPLIMPKSDNALRCDCSPIFVLILFTMYTVLTGVVGLTSFGSCINNH